MGLGRFGGGVGVSRFLARGGAKILVTDLASPQSLQTSCQQLADLPIDYRLGEHRLEDFRSADLIVVNPAVNPKGNPFLAAADEAGVPTTSEIRLLTARLPRRDRTIGITGTAGKSTVTAMIGHVLKKTLYGQTGRVWIGGNIGGSLLETVDQIGPEDWVVLELSSFMLESLRPDRFSPYIAVITNLSANHLDRHHDFETYVRIKQSILDFKTPDDPTPILGPNVPGQLSIKTDSIQLPQPRPHVPLLLPGAHNQTNALLALRAAAQATGRETRELAGLLADFNGLPHRMELVCEHEGVRYYNDSKATTPEATQLALKSFPPGTVHLIMGGADKQVDLDPTVAFASNHCRAIYTVGACEQAIIRVAEAGSAEVICCTTLDRALSQAWDRLQCRQVLLLSPGCASWDQFDHFEQRGHAFVDAVLQYTGQRRWPSRGSRGTPAPTMAPSARVAKGGHRQRDRLQ